jgi:Tfp pilus assembly protein PilO
VNRRGPLVAALVGAGLVVLTVVGLVLPKAHQVRERQKEVTKAEEVESGLRVSLQQLQAAAQGADKDLKRLKTLEAEIPPTADLPGLIRLVNDAAERSAVDFMAMAPAPPSAAIGSQLSVIPTQLTVVGGFFAVDQFLFRMETLPRIAKVMSLTVTTSENEEGANKLQVMMTAEFYTTDTSAGPGSVPGGAGSAFRQFKNSLPEQPNDQPAPGASPSPSPSPSPEG